jgi:hypothetical protein
MACRRRKSAAVKRSATALSLPPPDEEIQPTSLTATSDTRLLWPLPVFQASHVLLHNDDCVWNAGTFPPATLRLELRGTPARLTRMALQTEMEPATARVRHEIRIGPSLDAMRTASWFDGTVSTKSWIEIELDGCEDEERRPRPVRFIEIVTHDSPSYVAWRRIRVWKLAG